jgi:hypothetical protein
MKHIVIRRSMIVALIGMVALSTIRAAARENGSPAEIEDFANAVLSLAPGQTLRISVANPPEQASPGEPVTFTATIYTPNGGVIARSGEITVAPGEFHSFDFKRADLPLAGEPGTGRLQVRSEIRRRFFSGLPSRISQGRLPGMFELVDNGAGKTVAATSPGKPVQISNSSGIYQAVRGLLGLAPGQSLRASVANLNESGQRRLLRARIRLYGADGALIAQSDELIIPPGEFRSYDFHRSALPLAGEPGAGRLQVAVTYLFKVDGVDGTAASVSATLELVDNSAGATSAVLNNKILICTNGAYCFPVD